MTNTTSLILLLVLYHIFSVPGMTFLLMVCDQDRTWDMSHQYSSLICRLPIADRYVLDNSAGILQRLIPVVLLLRGFLALLLLLLLLPLLLLFSSLTEVGECCNVFNTGMIVLI